MMIARATYLLALGPLVKASRRPIQIPVYLADSLFLPTEVRQMNLGEVLGLEVRFGNRKVTIPDSLVEEPELFDGAIAACTRVAMSHAKFKTEGRATLEAYLSRDLSREVPALATLNGHEHVFSALGVSASIARRRFDRFLAGPGARDKRGYWLVRLSGYDLDGLLAQKVEYAVLSGFTYQRYQRACYRYPDPCRFYRELTRRATLVLAIDPGVDGQPLWVGDIYSPLTRLPDRTRPGPPIRIYRLPPLPGGIERTRLRGDAVGLPAG
jgi:hypothetical protein